MKHNRKILTILYFLFLFSGACLFAEEEITTITILNARQTSYKKAEDTGNDTILLEGSVILSVQKGNSTTEIKADKITYDRKTEMLFAEGNVAIETTGSGSSGGEKTTATSLLMNTSTLEGVFDGGRVVQTQSDALNLPSGSTLIVFADLFGKGSGNVISFKNSSLTFCDEEEPHWHIDATRTWLLPGGEFAFFNALLYVGVVPVLYFPAFYYPKDELIFNPVFSFRKREGYSIQTTTYVYGRKPLDTTSNDSTSTTTDSSSTSAESLKAIYNFVRPSTLKEQKLEGLVLHNLEDDYTGDTSQYLKILADYYSNLGYMIGFDGSFQPSKTYLTKLNFGADFGFSDTIFKNENTYYPFSKGGTRFKDSSTFLGLTLPFRYKANLELALSKPINISLSLPIYSDPFFSYDFLTHRTETMDWISYFLDNSGTTSQTTEETQTEISSFEWKFSTSFSPTIPYFITPYVSSLSFDMNSSINISSMTATFENTTDQEKREWQSYTPSRRFYYPALVTPANVNFSMSGTIFSWPLTKSSNSQSSVNYAINLNKPDEFKTQKQLEEEAKAKEQKEHDEDLDDEEEIREEEPEEETDENLFDYINPNLNVTVDSIKEKNEAFTYNLKYSVGANVTTQMAYASNILKKSEDFDWNNIRSYMYTVKVPVTVTSSLNYGGSLVSVDNSISYSPLFQKHPYVSLETEKGGYTENEYKTLLLADYNAETRDLINTNKFTISPLKNINFMSDSNITWNSNIKLFRRKFIGTVEEPDWENSPVDWDDEESITVNSLAATVSFKELDDKLKQALTLTMIMPPLLKEYSAALNLTFPYVTSSFSLGLQETTKYEVPEEEKWKKSPFNESVTVSLFDNKLKLNQSFSYNMEDKNPDNFKVSTSWQGLNLEYVMSYTVGYDFNNGWIPKNSDEKEFLPYSLTFSYTTPSKTFYKWFNRISIAPSLNTSISADLLRPTNSYFIFSPALTFKINDFFDITFSSTSRNSVLYWYFHEGLYDEWGGFPGNMFKDLFDSFRFDDKSKREGSGFKLKSLNMTVSHALHDWKFNMTLKIEPRLLTENNQKYYDFNPYLTIGIVWNPMESMKTSIVDEYGEWKLE